MKRAANNLTPCGGDVPKGTEGGIVRHILRLLVLLMTLLPLPALAASKADVEAQFQTWVQKDLWPEAKKDGVS